MESSSLTRDRTPGPLNWEWRVLATGPRGKSLTTLNRRFFSLGTKIQDVTKFVTWNLLPNPSPEVLFLNPSIFPQPLHLSRFKDYSGQGARKRKRREEGEAMGMATGGQRCSWEAGERRRWCWGWREAGADGQKKLSPPQPVPWRRNGGPGKGSRRGALRRRAPHRLDVAVQEAHRVDGLDGLQDLLPQPQRGAQREGAPRLTAAQVSQVPALR